ncbi:MAG: hypothetical protein JXA21_02585 [Anaerolineae bacterium]|nr:hypothetical protein [Anaerolineae bacterium]
MKIGYDKLLFGCHSSSIGVNNQWLLTNHLPALIFLCADERLLTAAVAEGLVVDNPNTHP